MSNYTIEESGRKGSVVVQRKGYARSEMTTGHVRAIAIFYFWIIAHSGSWMFYHEDWTPMKVFKGAPCEKLETARLDMGTPYDL